MTSPHFILFAFRWISTHYRMKGYFADEDAEVVKTYNEGMRRFFDSGGCADVNYADVYNMTQRLGVDHPQEVSEQYRAVTKWLISVAQYKNDICAAIHR